MTNDYIVRDCNHCALLTIDVQRVTAIKDAPLEIKGTLESVPSIRRLVQAFRDHHSPIIHVVRLYHIDGSNVDLCRRLLIENGKKILVPGSDDSFFSISSEFGI